MHSIRLYEILNPPWLKPGGRATIGLAPTGRSVADGMTAGCRAPHADRDMQVVCRLQAFGKIQLVRPFAASVRSGVSSIASAHFTSSSSRSAWTRNAGGVPRPLFLLTARRVRN